MIVIFFFWTSLLRKHTRCSRQELHPHLNLSDFKQYTRDKRSGENYNTGANSVLRVCFDAAYVIYLVRCIRAFALEAHDPVRVTFQTNNMGQAVSFDFLLYRVLGEQSGCDRATAASTVPLCPSKNKQHGCEEESDPGESSLQQE